MKTKYFTILIIAIALVWTGCHDVLDKKDLSAVTYEDVWNTEILATAYLDKLYRDNMPEWSTDPATWCDEQDGGGWIKRGELQIGGMAYFPYDKIYRINILLENLTGDPGNNMSSLSLDKQKEMRAQALFLRAWQYYSMIIRFGGVPYIKKPQDRYNDDLYVFRDKTSDCVKWLCEDLDEAAASLPSAWPSTQDFGRITKGAAMALKGRVLMFWASEIANPTNIAQRWTDAYNACLAARTELGGPGNRALHPNFRQIWGTSHTSETVITTRYKYPARTHTAEASIRPLEVSQNIVGGHRPSLDFVLAFPMKDGKPAGSSAYAPDNFTPEEDAQGKLCLNKLFWLNRDPRFYVTFTTNGSYFPAQNAMRQTVYPLGYFYTFEGIGVPLGNSTNMFSQKFLRMDITPPDAYFGDLDWIEMRYAEVLLNLAECAAETNRFQDAYDIIKQIRARAGIEEGDGNYGLPAIAGMSKQNVIDAVMLERQIELAFECKRFWDMRRRKMFQKAPFINNYFNRRLYITRITEAGDNRTHEEFVLEELSTLLEIQEKINTSKYFNYFYTEVRDIGQPWIVPDKCANFWSIPVNHYEQNKNFAQTAGWDPSPGQELFNPLE